MTTRILPDLTLSSRVNRCWTESGLDSLSNCLDKAHFASYPYPVEYNYNSRGFRDAEWPNNLSELKDAVWVFGDSFTVGLGSPISHTWPYAVAQELNKRVINVSMDGASNEWIARRAVDVYHAVQPSNMIIMWSYFHRRELADTSRSDEARRLWLHTSPKPTGIWLANDYTVHDADIDNFRECMNKATALPVNCIHFTIPYAVADIRNAYLPISLESSIQQRTDSHHYCGSVPRLDIARDGHHFDIVSSHWVAATVGQQWQSTRC